MKLIQQITADPLQQQVLILPDGSGVTIQLYYRPNQYGWFFNQISWNGFLAYGIRITNSPDILYQFKNQLTFGIGCFSNANREPTQIEDFASGASKLYLLSQEEVLAYQEFLQDG